MNRHKKKNLKNQRQTGVKCAWCNIKIEPYEPACLSDDEWMHLHCAAEEADEVGFDDFFGDN